jgi:hypothetical protein
MERNSDVFFGASILATIEDLQSIAQEFFKTESIAVAALGNLSGLKISRDQLTC